ncbi:MAG: DUF92 domain-containing protein [Candidatus Methanoplasma sp.]|jgi:uncharacterized protein (TIGR00297 family)|nr:DUF92 domain-containing protein [Candidatus Methanoplasma sp.]
MDLLAQLGIAFVLSALLSAIAYKLRMLTYTGALASFFVGYVVGLFSSIEWLVILIVFTAAGLIATKMDIGDKYGAGLQEGAYGERSAKNVLGVGLPPVIIAVLYAIVHNVVGNQYDLGLTVAFVSTLTVAAADTLASEVGVKDRKVWLITNFKRVKRGTNGGVSVLGTIAAIVASVITAIIGWLIIYGGIDVYVIVPILMGILGSVLDSVFGATLETRGIISKYVNNGSTALIGALIGFAIILFI